MIRNLQHKIIILTSICIIMAGIIVVLLIQKSENHSIELIPEKLLLIEADKGLDSIVTNWMDSSYRVRFKYLNNKIEKEQQKNIK